jgi:hypothetical protein
MSMMPCHRKSAGTRCYSEKTGEKEIDCTNHGDKEVLVVTHQVNSKREFHVSRNLLSRSLREPSRSPCWMRAPR